MKPHNRKNKKLIFIRVKNGLRTGKIRFYCAEKVTQEWELEHKYDTDKLLETARKSLLKTWKLKLPNYHVRWGFTDDDFVKNMVTYSVTLYLK